MSATGALHGRYTQIAGGKMLWAGSEVAARWRGEELMEEHARDLEGVPAP